MNESAPLSDCLWIIADKYNESDCGVNSRFETAAVKPYEAVKWPVNVNDKDILQKQNIRETVETFGVSEWAHTWQNKTHTLA